MYYQSRRQGKRGIHRFTWLLFLLIFFGPHSWAWFIIGLGIIIALSLLIKAISTMGSSHAAIPIVNQPPQQQPYQPYQPYQQGYQPSPWTYQEGEQQYQYPQYEDQPQAQYPQELPPMEQ